MVGKRHPPTATYLGASTYRSTQARRRSGPRRALVLATAAVIALVAGAVGSVAAKRSDGVAGGQGAGIGAGVPPQPDRVDGAKRGVTSGQSRRQPVVGPGRPPLPRDSGGPFGSRITTGTSDIALTFDDGPHEVFTPRILAALRRHRLQATFCVVGVNVVRLPALVRQIAADGHTLCNHSWSHDVALGSRSPAVIRADLARTTAAIRDAVPGSLVSYYRQPGGAWTAAVVDVAQELGMTALHWAVDPKDWRRPSARRITATVCRGTQAGSIVLLHDGGGDRRATVTALDSVLPDLTGRFNATALPPGIPIPYRYGLQPPA
jgi:peptidoglycan/xylan/chitin deacetylase (PgdA/CDA1 family)